MVTIVVYHLFTVDSITLLYLPNCNQEIGLIMGDINPMDINGGALVAMKGENCVAIGSDRRFGIEHQTISDNMQKMFRLGDYTYIGMAGLVTDSIQVFQRLRFRVNLYELKERRRMRPKILGSVVSNMLYEKRMGPYFVNPVIAGLDPDTYQPYICNMDVIGCRNEPADFVVAGTCSGQLYGACEALWAPDMGPDQLFETLSQALVNSCDRDAMSGWGAEVHVIEADKITSKMLKTRMD